MTLIWSDVVERKNNFLVNHHHQFTTDITSQLKEIPTKVIHPNVSDLPGLLLLVALAIHSAVDHQLTCT